MLSKTQQKQLYTIMLTPIVVDKLANSIKIRSNVIKSTQQYKGVADPDMSDLSVKFYEIIYKDILSKNGIIEKKMLGRIYNKGNFMKNSFVNTSFAGDTMNSFKTITGKLIKTLTIADKPICNYYYAPDDAEGRLKLILSSDAKLSTKKLFYRFYNLYHSLANFWVIPTDMGRRSPKTVYTDEANFKTQDYMEKFLKKIEYNWDNLINQKRFSLYFKKFDDYNNFVKRQFISASDYLDAPKDESGSRGSLSEEKAVEIVSGMMRAIKNRAVLLST